MKKVVKVHQFDPVIYPVKIWISIGLSPEGARDRFVRRNGDPLIIPEYFTAFVELVKQREDPYYYGVLVVFRSKQYCKVKDIAHESAHVADFIWYHLGEETHGSEANAYLVGWAGKCIEEVKRCKT